MFYEKNKIEVREVLKYGVLTGIVEGFMVLGAALVWFNRSKIFLTGGWEYPVTLVILGLLVVSAIISTYFIFAHPYRLVCRGCNREALWTSVAAALTVGLFVILIIFLNFILV